MLSDVQAVVFDLDGTLLDRRRSFDRFVRDQWQRFAHFLKAIDQEQYVQTLIDIDRDGYRVAAGPVTASSRTAAPAAARLHGNPLVAVLGRTTTAGCR
jgi:phosphoglycolate phosphatase-like HAD superfamily hydrolase